jgi:acetate kinase
VAWRGADVVEEQVEAVADHPDLEFHAAEVPAPFVYRTSQAIASYAVALEGFDALVFTADIGEHASANRRHGPRISTACSPISAWVIPTNEEQMIARHT